MSIFSRWFKKAPAPAALAAPKPAMPAPKPVADKSAALAAEAAALQQAVAAADQAALARMVATGLSTKTRQAAAQALADAETIKQLLRDLRGGKDQSAYQILVAKRDAQVQQQRESAARDAEVAAAAQDLRQHSQRKIDIAFAPLLAQLETRWAQLAAHADAATAQQAAGWIAEARQRLAAQAQEVAERAQAAAAASAAQAAQQAAAQAAAEEAKRLAAEAAQVQTEQQQAEQAAQKGITDLVRKARLALGDGNSQRVASLRRDIDAQIAQGAVIPAFVQGQLQQIDLQLAELKAWKAFSVAPKRVELLAAMQALIGAEMPPVVLSERIKQLQGEWRSLSRGAADGNESDEDSQRFNEAAQQAYEPCKAYFAAQAEVLGDNLARREAILRALTAFDASIDWATPNWKAIITTLRDSKQAWREVGAIDRRVGQKQQDAYFVLAKRLQQRIDQEFAKNTAQKQSLIDQAKALLGSDDARKAIEQVKALQQSWQTIGLVPRDADQRLWGSFREACDAVFKRREVESSAQYAEREQQKAAAIALCEQAENCAVLSGDALITAHAGLGAIKAQFEALGELPRADARQIQQRFAAAIARCDAALKRQHAQSAEQSWVDLLHASSAVRAHRLTMQNGGDVAASQSALDTQLSAVARWPKGGREALDRLLAMSNADDLASNASALQQLCLRAEILTNAPTPPEYLAARREVQLQRLVSRMGQGGAEADQNLNELSLAWMAVGAVPAAVDTALRARFLACRAYALA